MTKVRTNYKKGTKSSRGSTLASWTKTAAELKLLDDHALSSSTTSKSRTKGTFLTDILQALQDAAGGERVRDLSGYQTIKKEVGNMSVPKTNRPCLIQYGPDNSCHFNAWVNGEKKDPYNSVQVPLSHNLCQTFALMFLLGYDDWSQKTGDDYYVENAQKAIRWIFNHVSMGDAFFIEFSFFMPENVWNTYRHDKKEWEEICCFLAVDWIKNA